MGRQCTFGLVSGTDMERFWDARAREDPFHFVDDREPYRAADLDRFWARGERDLDHLLRTLGARIEEGDAVVDLGCGVGRLTRVIAARAGQVWAVDVSGEMLDRARRLNPALENVEWVHGDGRTLRPISDQAADAVISHVTFQHLPDPGLTYDYVGEIGRVLRPGGWAAFQVSDDPSIHRPPRSLGERVLALAGRVPRGRRSPAWVGSAVSQDALHAAVESAGMAVKRVEGTGTQFCLVLVRKH
jgi:SAM-dependent methyltransferase